MAYLLKVGIVDVVQVSIDYTQKKSTIGFSSVKLFYRGKLFCSYIILSLYFIL